MAEKMRLVCPNCSAQYEVDAAVIPVAGRDVQCSNCGHTWWQRRAGPGAPAAPTEEPLPADDTAGAEPPDQAEAAAEDLAEIRAQVAAESGTPAHQDAAVGTHPAAAEDAQVQGTETGNRPLPEDWTDEDEDDGDSALPPRADLAARRKSLDEAVLDVLREEAEREAQARQGGGGADADPSDAALVASLGRGEDDREAAVRARMDAMDGAGRPGGRGNQRLPDVEEINSTLEGRVSEPAAAVEEDRSLAAYYQRRAGFRLGFTAMLLVALAILMLYTFADRIVASVPSMEPGMASFVQTVDAGRIWLNSAATEATEAIRGVTQTE
jgi:predicted Zn finger-like uncharacterized protein